jgi:hypothetical protein
LEGGEEKDTLPVTYKMNSRKQLKKLFKSQGFEELSFCYLNDLSTYGKFKTLSMIELIIRKALKK